MHVSLKKGIQERRQQHYEERTPGKWGLERGKGGKITRSASSSSVKPNHRAGGMSVANPDSAPRGSLVT